MNLILRFWTGIIFILLLSCSRGTTDPGNGNGNGGPHVYNPADTIPPGVDIYTPSQNQIFTSGASVNITGRVTDGDGLYRGSIRIFNDASGSMIKEQLYEIHGVYIYNFNISHVISVSTTSDFTVTVSYEDHGQNVTTRSVKIKVNP